MLIGKVPTEKVKFACETCQSTLTEQPSVDYDKSKAVEKYRSHKRAGHTCWLIFSTQGTLDFDGNKLLKRMREAE